jgi:hypothetical protein
MSFFNMMMIVRSGLTDKYHFKSEADCHPHTFRVRNPVASFHVSCIIQAFYTSATMKQLNDFPVL